MEQIILKALDTIPPVFRKKIENVEIVLEEYPTEAVRVELKLSSRDILFGLYQGIPRLKRGADYGNALPDKITLYQKALEGASRDLQDLQQNVRDVLLHEVGHYFGMSEGQLRKIERTKPLGLVRKKGDQT